MRNFILSVVLLFTTIFAFGQINYEATSVSESTKDNTGWQELLEVHYPVIVSDNSITIYGPKLSIYIVTDYTETVIEGVNVLIMDALDNKNNNCEIWLVTGDRNYSLLIFYEHKSIGYLLVPVQ